MFCNSLVLDKCLFLYLQNILYSYYWYMEMAYKMCVNYIYCVNWHWHEVGIKAEWASRVNGRLKWKLMQNGQVGDKKQELRQNEQMGA